MAINLTIGGQRTLHPGELAESATELNTPFDFWQRANIGQ